jgi:hypothetical protein
MTPSDVTPVLEVGQFWARMNPLALMQCTDDGEGLSATFHVWTAGTQTEVFRWAASHVRYLWCDILISPSVFLGHTPNPGDVWICGHTNQLFFIGPCCSRAWIQVLADWACEDTLAEAWSTLRIFQKVPASPAQPSPETGPDSAIDRLLNNHELV